MTDSALLDPFEEAVIRGVAAENNVEKDQLCDALVDHQQTMRDNPGVEDLVYEWRKQYDEPVLERTEGYYIVAVPRSVWEEFGSYLGLDDYLLAAVSAVHQEQVLRSATIDHADIDPERIPLVVVREQ